MLLSHSHNRTLTRRWHSKRSLTLVAIALLGSTLTSTTWFASAQHVAGKFASRAKLSDEGSTHKKKRKFFGGGNTITSTTDDGEFRSYFWTRWRRRTGAPQHLSSANEYYSQWPSSWELVLVESQFIFISLITSIICVAFSWIWYSCSADGGSSRKEDADNFTREEEDGGEYKLNLFLPPDSFLTMHSELSLQ